MTVAKFTQPNNTTQTASEYKANLDAAAAVLNRIAGTFAPHEAATPNMTVVVDAGSLLTGTTLTEKSQQTTATITAPVSNPRIDRVVIDSTTGVVSVIAGAEAASPSAPAITAGKLPVAQVLLQTGSTTITNSMITDERTAIFGGYAALNGSSTQDFSAQNLSAFDAIFSGGISVQGITIGLGGGSSIYNTANGFQALYSNSTGYNNFANGYQALYSNTAGIYNAANAFQALYSNTTGNYNTASGTLACYSNSTGDFNTASGLQALYSNTTGSNNFAGGGEALYLNNGNYNIGVGKGAGSAITTGSNNTVIGSVPGTSAMADTVLIAAGTTERLRVDASGLSVNSVPVYTCRAWVNFNGTGTVAIRESGNVSSITDHGTGEYTVNFTAAMPDANYAVLSSSSGATMGQTGVSVTAPSLSTPTTTAVRLYVSTFAGTTDGLYVNVAIIR